MHNEAGCGVQRRTSHSSGGVTGLVVRQGAVGLDVHKTTGAKAGKSEERRELIKHCVAWDDLTR